MSNYRCESCSYTNWINDPIDINGRPLQDWFCNKCSSKLFSVSFVKPSHSDAKPITCQSCATTTKIVSTAKELGKLAIWKCPKCQKPLISLLVKKTASDQSSMASTPNAVNESKSVTENKDQFHQFLKSNWLIISVVFLGLFMWINSSGFGNVISSKNNSSASPAKQNVYRGTMIAEQEFQKYSKSERLRIQKFFKDDFGYRSSIDGLWGHQTASSFIRAADRYAIGKSLDAPANVNIVFKTALKNQRTNVSIIPPKPKTQNISKFGLTDNQIETYQHLHKLCYFDLNATSQERLRCVQNALCQVKFGKPCGPETQQNQQTPSICQVIKGRLRDQVICF